MSADLRQRIEGYMATNPPGWAWQTKAMAMADLIVGEEPRIVVELGVFGGRSLIPQAMALQEMAFGTIYGIDPWRREDALESIDEVAHIDWWSKCDLHEIHRQCMEAIWSMDLSNHVIILRTTSVQAATLFQEHSVSILHIDSNHSELASTRDVVMWLPRMISKGYIWLDDSNWASTQKAVAMLEAVAERLLTLESTEGGETRLYQLRS